MSDILTPDEVNGIEPSDRLEMALVNTIRAAWAEWDEWKAEALANAGAEQAADELRRKAEAERDELRVMFNSSQASLSVIVADAKQKVKTIEAERDRIMKLLHDLTPMGSEFANNPERCAKWVQDAISSKTQLTARAYAERKKAEAERDSALTKLKQYEERDRVEANRHRLSPPSHLEDIADAIIRAERDQARAEAAELKRIAVDNCVHCEGKGVEVLNSGFTEPCPFCHDIRAALAITTLTAKHIELDQAMERVCEAALSFDRLSWVCLTGVEQGKRMAEAMEALKAVQE